MSKRPRKGTRRSRYESDATTDRAPFSNYGIAVGAAGSDYRKAGQGGRVAISDDRGFEHMLADLLLKITKLFDQCGATRLELSPLRLHATSYHIEKAAPLHEKPLRITTRLEPDSHDRRAVFDHRHGDSIKNPKWAICSLPGSICVDDGEYENTEAGNNDEVPGNHRYRTP
jgi:hypothetical protein